MAAVFLRGSLTVCGGCRVRLEDRTVTQRVPGWWMEGSQSPESRPSPTGTVPCASTLRFQLTNRTGGLVFVIGYSCIGKGNEVWLASQA